LHAACSVSSDPPSTPWQLPSVPTRRSSDLPKQKPTDAKPAAIDDFNLPTISETRNWPWMAGTCLIEGGNVTWYGDLRTEEIKKKDRKSTRLNSSHVKISYAVFCLKKKTQTL